jgi:hypothetical protein
MKRFAIAVVASLALGLAACQTAPTPYQPLGTPGATLAGGFTDQRLDDTHFRVTFKGNYLTSRDQVETYLLYRAADLAQSQGFDWFEMVSRQTSDHGVVTTSWAPYWRYHGAFGWGAWDPYAGGPFWDDGDVQQLDQYEAVAEIAVGHGPKPADDVRAFDAHQVMANLGPKIVRAPPPH